MTPFTQTHQLDRESTFESNQSTLPSGELFFVSCYSDFEKLAHGPRGTEASSSIYVYRFHPSDGSMVLLNVSGDPDEVMNPAFTRLHPRFDVVYTCTEDISSEGKIIAYAIDSNGVLTKISEINAGGKSTCYLTIDNAQKNLLAVNYWDSTIVTIPISLETGEFTGPLNSVYDPKGGKALISAARKDGGVNHSNNDESTIKMRQADPHSHAIVLDPYFGRMAYVPCLGKDLIREFFYNAEKGCIDKEINSLPSGLSMNRPDGPRYVVFHPTFDIMYVVNELSSTVAVFSVNRKLLREMNADAKEGLCMDHFKGKSTLTLIQSIKVIPRAFPTKMNTCGRICVHASGRFVLVSNRGHQSIAVLRVKTKGLKRGQLELANYFHTRGETPRHFVFDSSGQFLLVANQDSDNISVFNFNQCNGDLKFTGNEYRVPSPNFVCSCPLNDDENTDLYEKEFEIETMIERQSDHSSSSSTGLELQLSEAKAEIFRLQQQLALVTPKVVC